MAGYQRVGWPELAVVQMQIRPADPGNQDAEQHLTRAGFGEGNLAYRELARPVLDHGLHRVYLCTPGRVDSREARSFNCQANVYPPSINSSVPQQNAAASLSSHPAAAATSRGSANRASGVAPFQIGCMATLLASSGVST